MELPFNHHMGGFCLTHENDATFYGSQDTYGNSSWKDFFANLNSVSQVGFPTPFFTEIGISQKLSNNHRGGNMTFSVKCLPCVTQVTIYDQCTPYILLVLKVTGVTTCDKRDHKCDHIWQVWPWLTYLCDHMWQESTHVTSATTFYKFDDVWQVWTHVTGVNTCGGW